MAEKAIKKKQDVQFHKDTFDKTTAERRQRVIDVAISEFAAKGYNATNINDITRKSRISIGAMYSYFASKEDLFLAVVNKAYELLDTALKEARGKYTDVFDLLGGMLKASREYAVKFPELNQIYLDLTTQGLSQMAGRLSNKLESITVQLYRDVLKKAKSEGKIAKEIDENVIAFVIDNLFIMYQFSFSVDYYKERMKIFLDEASFQNTDEVENRIMHYIRRLLEA